MTLGERAAGHRNRVPGGSFGDGGESGSMAAIVLVPGFWLGQWAWAEVAGALSEAGHDVYPVTLTGLADRAAEANPEVNVDTHIADIIGVVRDNDLQQVG